ncbi:MAG: GAK system CofD-like protein [Desulfovibrio sp.]|nr:GAK system CofD-like protein [Desulfovibrio sp.]
MKAGKIVFFSGGTALRRLARALATDLPNTVHLVTTFDSGGSSAILRKTFAIPAVGDIRNRLLSLADPSFATPEIINLCDFRIPTNISFEEARAELSSFSGFSRERWRDIPDAARDVLSRCLRFFFQRMPGDFEARGANLGNLCIAGAYLEFNRDFISAINLFAKVLRARGTVLPITSANLHLGARLKNGSTIVGQHLFKKLPAPVASLFLTVHESVASLESEPIDCFPAVFPESEDFIRRAKVVVYPMGSFYSSIVANLVPQGVGRAVAETEAAKIFIPNTGYDPELQGLTIPEQVEVILDTLRKEAPEAPVGKLLGYVLIDKKRGAYPGSFTSRMEDKLREMGIRSIDREMVYENDPGKHDPEAVLNVLKEFAERKRT